EPQKDFETLLKAFHRLKQNYSANAKLIIVGEGPLREPLAALADKLGIQADVDFVGFHHNPYAFMSATDVYVSSSRYEGLPNTLIEALSLRKRVVATACKGGTAEILKYGKYGRLVPVSSPDVMARSIAESLMSPNPVDPGATKDFDYEAQVYKYFSLFQQVLGTPKATERYARRPQEAPELTVH
ncbi:MAG: glycosyltransferase, partial [Cyanobacteria bacterium J06598_3]